MKMENKQLEHQDFEIKQNKYPLSLLLNNISSPLNVGGFFRLADALGIEKIYFAGNTPVPPSSKINKTSRSTEKYVDFEKVENIIPFLKELQIKNHEIICLEICNTSKDLNTFKVELNKKYCLVLGEENKGVAQEILDMANGIYHIPMEGVNSSMNVVSACAIASYTIINQLK